MHNINLCVFFRPQIQRNSLYEESVVLRGLVVSKGIRFVIIYYIVPKTSWQVKVHPK